MNLFEINKLLTFQNNEKQNEQLIRVNRYTIKLLKKKTLIAIFVSNGYLLLYRVTRSSVPEVTVIPWFSRRPITQMCFDESGCWLCVITAASNDFFIVPAFCQRKRANSNRLWKVDDVTQVSLKGNDIPAASPIGHVTCMCWWQTVYRDPVLILGTQLGFLMLINLHRSSMVKEIDVSDHVTSISIVRTAGESCVYLLISCKGGAHWRLLLEMKSDSLSSTYTTRRRDFVNIMRNDSEYAELFSLGRIQNFTSTETVSCQRVAERQCIVTHDAKSGTLAIYFSLIDTFPMFVFRVPLDIVQPLYSSSVLCLISENRSKLTLVSSRLSEVTSEKNSVFDKEAVVGKFTMPESEAILDVIRTSSPGRTWKDVGGSSKGRIKGLSYVNVDEFIILTTGGLWICKPKRVPEHLFLDQCSCASSHLSAIRCGFIFGLDVNVLCRVAAEECLVRGEPPLALKLLQMTKCSDVEKVKLFLRYRYIKVTVDFLKSSLSDTLNWPSEVSQVDRVTLSKALFLCLIHQQLGAQDEKCRLEQKEFLRRFLGSNYSLDKQIAMTTLYKCHLYDLLIEMARERSCVVDVLSMLAATPNSSCSSYEMADTQLDCMLELLMMHRLVQFIKHHPTLSVLLLSFILTRLDHATNEQLYKIINYFDITNPYIHRHLSYLTRCSEDVGQPTTRELLQHLVSCFINAVLVIHSRHNTGYSNFLSGIQTKTSQVLSSTPVERHLLHHRSTIGCGQSHVVCIFSETELSSWGKATDGRLGIGSTVFELQSRAQQIPSLCNTRIHVLSVTCGNKHTLALTSNGLYGWGSSVYGQVGSGARDVYKLPVHIHTEEHVAMVICGQYHSALVTTNCKLYTWGWGLFGQLGHGHVEDILSPTLVAAMADVHTVSVALGQAHSLFLSEQGLLYSCGCGAFGQLGSGSVLKQTLPARVSSLNESISSVFTKYCTSFAVTNTNRLYFWGCDPCSMHSIVDRQISTSNKRRKSLSLLRNYLLPVLLPTTELDSAITQVHCGYGFAVILTLEGHLYVTGFRPGLQRAGVPPQNSLTLVSEFITNKVTEVSCGPDFVIATDEAGVMWGWGKNDSAQLAMQPSFQSNLAHVPGHTPQSRSTLIDNNIIDKPTKLDVPLSRLAKDQLFNGHLHGDNVTAALWWFEEMSLIDESVLSNEVNEPYNPSALIHTLQLYPDFCNTQSILQRSLKLMLHDIVASVYLLQKDFVQSCTYMLKYVSFKHMSAEPCVDIFTSFLQLLAVNFHNGQLLDITSIITMMVTFWFEHHWPTQIIEELLSKFLVQSVFVLAAYTAVSRVMHKSMAQFSSQFLFRLTAISLSSLSTNPEFSNDLHSVLSETVSPEIDMTLVTSDLISDITSKSSSEPKHMFLSSQDVQRITKAANTDVHTLLDSLAASHQQYCEIPVVLFSCGHHMTSARLQCHLADLRELAEQHDKLSTTLLLLIGQYQKNKSVLNVACPSCTKALLFSLADSN